jgi:hypothetical protein
MRVNDPLLEQNLGVEFQYFVRHTLGSILLV